MAKIDKIVGFPDGFAEKVSRESGNLESTFKTARDEVIKKLPAKLGLSNEVIGHLLSEPPERMAEAITKAEKEILKGEVLTRLPVPDAIRGIAPEQWGDKAARAFLDQSIREPLGPDIARKVSEAIDRGDVESAVKNFRTRVEADANVFLVDRGVDSELFQAVTSGDVATGAAHIRAMSADGIALLRQAKLLSAADLDAVLKAPDLTGATEALGRSTEEMTQRSLGKLDLKSVIHDGRIDAKEVGRRMIQEFEAVCRDKLDQLSKQIDRSPAELKALAEQMIAAGEGRLNVIVPDVARRLAIDESAVQALVTDNPAKFLEGVREREIQVPVDNLLKQTGLASPMAPNLRNRLEEVVAGAREQVSRTLEEKAGTLSGIGDVIAGRLDGKEWADSRVKPRIDALVGDAKAKVELARQLAESRWTAAAESLTKLDATARGEMVKAGSLPIGFAELANKAHPDEEMARLVREGWEAFAASKLASKEEFGRLADLARAAGVGDLGALKSKLPAWREEFLGKQLGLPKDAAGLAASVAAVDLKATRERLDRESLSGVKQRLKVASDFANSWDELRLKQGKTFSAMIEGATAQALMLSPDKLADFSNENLARIPEVQMKAALRAGSSAMELRRPRKRSDSTKSSSRDSSRTCHSVSTVRSLNELLTRPEVSSSRPSRTNWPFCQSINSALRSSLAIGQGGATGPFPKGWRGSQSGSTEPTISPASRSSRRFRALVRSSSRTT